MKNPSDTYRTLLKVPEGILHKERKSKFYGYAFPVKREEEISAILIKLSKMYPNANHICYAWQLGTGNTVYKINDDGEPNNSAGMPIYGQILAFKVTNVLVVVVRTFGGTKLGIGGLIRAYRTAANMSLENSKIVVKTIQQEFLLIFPYSEMDKVMCVIKQRYLRVLSRKMEVNCTLRIGVRQTKADHIEEIFRTLRRVSVKRMD
jgi:uncharacterized YigZ family protein